MNNRDHLVGRPTRSHLAWLKFCHHPKCKLCSLKDANSLQGCQHFPLKSEDIVKLKPKENKDYLW